MSNLTGEVIKRMVHPQISKANIAVTWRCNQRCKSCNIWQTSQGNAEEIQDEFTVAEYETFIKHSGLMWISLTGGEPTLRPDIAEIMALSSRYLVKVNITTNGSNPALLENGIRRAMKHGDALISCNLSCEGDEQTHNTFAGKKDSWGSMIESVQRLKMLRCYRFSVKLETVLTSENDGEAVRKLAKKLNVPLTYAIEQEAQFYRNTKPVSSEPPRQTIKLPNLSLSPMPTSDELANYFLIREYKRKKKMACVAGQYSVFIDPYLNVYPCIFRYPQALLGNLDENHYNLQGMATRIYTKGCHCATPCETQVGMMFRPWRVL
jgi:MoaA/NifB/PqqE/SkfB family radical SAM enzyme